jgi:hypothetical protein
MILHIFVKKNPMNKKLASQQYAANQMGMADRKRPKKSDGGGEGMSCSKEGCGAYNSGSGRSGVGEKTNRQNKGGAKGLSMRPKYQKNIIKPGSLKEKRHKRSLEKVRAAAQPKKLKSKF